MNKLLIMKSGIVLFFLLIIVSGCSKQPEHLVEIPWVLSGQEIILDSHSHTYFSDGRLSVSALVDKAIANGCDALVVTDHSDLSERAATPAYFNAIKQARKDHPDFVLLSGIEWNIPPYDGREHVNLIVNPALEQDLLTEFKQRFDEGDSAVSGLQWLAKKTISDEDAVLFYNHPARKDSAINENYTDMRLWLKPNHLFAGFEGGPGHQNQSDPGTYKGVFKTVDRWDPVVTEVGGVWDSLLDEGENLWGALATSDFHNHKIDYYPCEFARIHINVQDQSPIGVLKALRAGSFWADHGKLLNKFDFFVYAKGLEYPAIPGETISLGSAQDIEVYIDIALGAGSQREDIDAELITNCRSGKPELLQQKFISSKILRVSWKLTMLKSGKDGKSCYVRSRIRKQIADGPDLMAYSNPIRIKI